MQLGPVTINHLMGVQIATLRWEDGSHRRPPTFDRDNNLVLTITQKYHFVQMNPGADGCVTDHDGHHFQVQPWADSEWISVCRSFINLANQFWNNQFWLRIPEACSQYNYSSLPWYPVVKPSVQCLYQAQSVCHDGDDVIRIEVANPTGISKEVSPDGSGAHFSFRANARRWIPSNTILTRNSGGNSQITVVHEVGHNLGEDHVAGLGGSIEDYGGVNPHPDDGSYHRSTSIMGSGMVFEGWNAYAWQFAMQRFTQIPFTQWEGSTRELFPDIPEPRYAQVPPADMIFTLEEAQARRPTIILDPVVISGRVRHRGPPHRRHPRH